MLGVEDLLCELNEDINEQGLPPGFRFHPTDEELITFYLASKVFNGSFCGVDIAEVDLNRCEPWELPDLAKMGEREWYFFSMRDRKYPTGLRTNRATGAGYWKATGKDREVYGASSGALLGMKKTLVFYKGRAPKGVKTKWVMHEYRLDGHFSYHHHHRHSHKEEWVICRIVNKIGEKKNPMFHCQSYHLMEAAASSPPATGSLPPLLESTPPAMLLKSQSHHQNPMLLQQQQALQNPFLDLLHHYQDGDHGDLKSLINPPINVLPPPPPSSFSPTPPPPNSTTTNNHPSPSTSLLFKSLLLSSSHHHPTTTTVPKQCKTEEDPYYFPLFKLLPDANLSWVDKMIHHNHLFSNQSELFMQGGNGNGNGMEYYCGVMGGLSSAAAQATFAPPPPPPDPHHQAIRKAPKESWPLDV